LARPTQRSRRNVKLNQSMIRAALAMHQSAMFEKKTFHGQL
jgi:hypothetical protein